MTLTPLEKSLFELTSEVKVLGANQNHTNKLLAIVDAKVEDVKKRVDSMPSRDSYLDDIDDKIEKQRKHCATNSDKTIKSEVSEQLLKQAQSKRTSSSTIKIQQISWWSSLTEKQRTSIITAVTGAIIALSTYLAAS